MTFNNEIYIQREITKRIEFLFILNNIRENIESHDKKENKKKDTTSHQNKTDIKKEYIKKSRIRILERIINISKHQE